MSVFAVGLPAMGAEKYSATVDDGTAEEIHPHTAVDEEKPEYLQAPLLPEPKRLRAPNQLSHNITTEPTVSDAAEMRKRSGKRRYERRLKDLEQAKVEKAAREAEETVEAAADEAIEVPALYPQDGIELDVDDAVAGPAPVMDNLSEEIASETQEAPVDPTEGVQDRLAQRKAARKELAKLPKTPGFDLVPDKRVGDIAERLKYTNDILKRFGRAYDYRTTTLTQFKRILAELESLEEKTQETN